MFDAYQKYFHDKNNNNFVLCFSYKYTNVMNYAVNNIKRSGNIPI